MIRKDSKLLILQTGAVNNILFMKARTTTNVLDES